MKKWLSFLCVGTCLSVVGMIALQAQTLSQHQANWVAPLPPSTSEMSADLIHSAAILSDNQTVREIQLFFIYIFAGFCGYVILALVFIGTGGGWERAGRAMLQILFFLLGKDKK